MSFIDSIRSQGQETWRRVVFAGFDPDLHDSGLGRVGVDVSSIGRTRISWASMDTISIPDELRGIDAANAMVQAVFGQYSLFFADEAIIESQQVYPPKAQGKKKPETMASIIHKANDLIMLSAVSGAAATCFRLCTGSTSNPPMTPQVRLMLPAQWKGQRDKKLMHAESFDILEKAGATYKVNGKDADLRAFRSVSQHPKDALGMALRCAGYKV